MDPMKILFSIILVISLFEACEFTHYKAEFDLFNIA